MTTKNTVKKINRDEYGFECFIPDFPEDLDFDQIADLDEPENWTNEDEANRLTLLEKIEEVKQNVKEEIARITRAKGLQLSCCHENNSQNLLGLEYYHAALPDSVFFLVEIGSDGSINSFSDFGRRPNSRKWQSGLHSMTVNNRYGVK